MNKNKNIFVGIGIVIFILLFLLATFFAGVYVGKRQDRTLTRMENMRRHGVIGIVQSISNSKIIIKEKTGEVKTVVLDTNTKFRQDRSVISQTSIKVGDTIIVLGESAQSDGTLKAKIIRVVDWDTRHSGEPIR